MSIVKTERGFVDLSNLVYSNNSGKYVNWDASIGKTVDFQYDDICGTLTINRRVSQQYVSITIPGYVTDKSIYVGQIRHGQLGGVLGVYMSEFRYSINDVVSNLIITEPFIRNKHKYYKYVCCVDGYHGEIREDHLVNGHGCPVCSGSVIMKGVNDIATTNPNMAKLFLNPEDAHRFSEHSNQYAHFKCPTCGNVMYKYVSDVGYNGLSCKKCDDGISYPNKFMYNLMEQLASLHDADGRDFSFVAEKRFDWSQGKIYDLYVASHDVIIENHGAQHYKNRTEVNSSWVSLEDIQSNDRLKNELAINNGIPSDKYISLDCSHSTLSHIKNSVMSSDLPKIFDFSEGDIDWAQCNKSATSSRVFEACQLWNSGMKCVRDIACVMKMHEGTIARYLKRGEELGLITR